MYVIIIIIISILILESYTIIKNIIPVSEIKLKKDVNFKKRINTQSLDEYTINCDKKIQHKPGKIYIKNDYNLFINTINYSTLMKKDYIYSIEVPFELEVLNLSEENIIYYYKEN